MIYVYLENNEVKDLVRVNPQTVFSPQYAAKFIACSNDNVSHGWKLINNQWVEPEPSVQVKTIPSITMRQARLKLHQMGLLTAVNDAIITMSQEAQIEWEYATSVEITNPLVPQIKTLLNLSDSQLESLFDEAASL